MRLVELSAVTKSGRRLSYVCAFGAAASAFVPLVGWAVSDRTIAGFGLPHPSFPFSSIAFLLIAGGLLGQLAGVRPRVVLMVLAGPVGIGLARLWTLAAGGGLGIDGWLFGPSVRAAVLSGAGRPGVLHALVLVLLPIAVAIAPTRARWRGRCATAIAGVVLLFALLSLQLVPQAGGVEERGWRFVSSSLPAAIETLLLAVGVLALRADRDAIGTSPEWRLFLFVTPLLLVEPVLASLIAYGVFQSGWTSPIWTDVLNVALNVLAIGVLLAWALRSAALQRSSLQELTGALDAAPIALVDGDGCVLHWSRGCETLYGWAAAEAVGRAKHELLRSRASSGAPILRADLLTDGERELSETGADGTTVHVIETARHVERDGGRTVIALSMTDIGARREAEASLRDSEERLALATSAHQIGLFEWDVPTGKLTWTAGSEQRLGLETGAIADYKSWAALVEPTDLEQVERTVADAAARRVERFSFRYRLKKASGLVRALEGSARCVYDEAGKLVRTNGVNLDITAHEEREAALRASEAHLRSILETVPDGMVVIDGEGVIRSFSPAAERLFGYGAAEATGRNVSMLVPGEHGRSHDSYLSRYRETGERRVIGHRRTMNARRADGGEFPVELHVGEAWVGHERLFTGFVRDISDRVAAEERISRVQDDLMHATRLNAVGEMAAALAHELNQPLSAVVNFVATAEILIGNESAGSPALGVLEQAREQALRAGEIIRRLREFIARREADVRIEPVAQTVREAAALLGAGRHHSDVRLVFDLDPAADHMLADRIQVQQVLVNLLRNAFEALATVPRDRRSVTIGSRRLGQQLIEISVSDCGPGLPAAVQAKTFTPFTSTKGEGGMGLGLSICQRIIEAHGGELFAENQPQGGARFRFTLPATSGEENRR